MGRGAVPSLQTPPAAGLDFLCSCTRKKNRAPAATHKAAPRKRNLFCIDWCDSEGWQCLQVVESEPPAYVNAELVTKGPSCRLCEVCDRQKQKMSDAKRMRNSVPRKHTLFNNLPQSEQKPAEIKPEAAKNAVLKSSRSTIRTGSGVELRVSFCQKGRGGPWQRVLETGNEGGERQAFI